MGELEAALPNSSPSLGVNFSKSMQKRNTFDFYIHIKRFDGKKE
jgi:hypothetical protein